MLWNSTKSIYTLCMLAASCLMMSCQKECIVFQEVEPLMKVFPEHAVWQEFKDTIDAPAGGHAQWQFALRSDAQIEGLTIECSELHCSESDCSESDCSEFVIEDVATGLVGYVGVKSSYPDAAHDVLRSTSGLYPDPVFFHGPYDVPASQASAVKLDVKVPENACAGIYRGEVSISGKCGGRYFSEKRPVVLKVWPVVLSKPVFNSTNWAFDTDELLYEWNCDKSVERYSPLYWEYITQMADMLKGAYQRVIQVPVLSLVNISEDSGIYSFDFSNFDKWIDIFTDRGALDYIQGAELGRRIVPGWEAPFGLYVKVREGSELVEKILDINDDRCRNFYGQFMPALYKHLKECGLADIYLQRICDEPVDANADSYRRISLYLKSLVPQMRVLEALQSTKLSGAVDVLVPQLNTLHENYDYFSSRQSAGDELWCYTCCYPRGEYPNRFIDQPLLKIHMLYWMCFKYGVTGHLHWGFNYWNTDPYAQTDMPGFGTSLPGGDSWIVYPGNNEFIPSIRYFAMRDAIEDHTLLSMLSQIDSVAASRIVDSAVFNWWVYTENPAQYRQFRREVLSLL